MGNVIEYQGDGAKLTYTASAAITGGQLVELTGDRAVGPAAADSVKVVGIAMYDAASGADVGVASEGVWPVTASGAITAGARLVAGAAGTAKVAPTGGAAYTQAETTYYQRLVGIALEAIADTATGRVKLAFLG